MDDQLEPLARVPFLERPMPAWNLGPPGELTWLPLNQLYIDREYQRHVLERGRRNIRSMIEGFSWALFGALVVGRRGLTRFAVIDGQHRAIAAMMHGAIEKVPCIILQGGRKQEAHAFSAINSKTTRIHPLQAFRADVTAGDPDSVETVQVCAHANVTIVPYPKTEFLPGETQSLGNIRQSIRVNGSDTTIAALKMLRTIDPQAGLSKNALVGAFQTLRKHPAWVDRAEEFGRRLARSLVAFEKEAKQRKLMYGGNESANFELLLTAAIKTLEERDRHAPRFASEAMRQRAMAGR